MFEHCLAKNEITISCLKLSLASCSPRPLQWIKPYFLSTTSLPRYPSFLQQQLLSVYLAETGLCGYRQYPAYFRFHRKVVYLNLSFSSRLIQIPTVMNHPLNIIKHPNKAQSSTTQVIIYLHFTNSTNWTIESQIILQQQIKKKTRLSAISP